MLTISNVEVYGWEAAIRGMRSPMNSWDRSDSIFDADGVKDFRLRKLLTQQVRLNV